MPGIFTYEYLVNGTEDEYVLTRLSPAEGAKRELRVIAEVRKLLRAQRKAKA
jgi:RNA-splicing ligase RtcB